MPVVERTFVRSWSGEPAEAVARMLATLQSAGFNLTAPTPWTLRGESGSQVAMSTSNVPVSVDVTVSPSADGPVSVHVRLADRFASPLVSPTVERDCEERFAEVERAVDAGLGLMATAAAVETPTVPLPPPPTAPLPPPPAAPLPPPPTQPTPTQPTPTQPLPPPPDPVSTPAAPPGPPPAAPPSPPPPVSPPPPPPPPPVSPLPVSAPAVADQPTRSGSGLDIAGLGEQAGAAWAKLAAKTQATATAASRRLRKAEAWQRVEEVVFANPPDVARADATRIQALVSVATMVERQPGSLPDKLSAQLDAFAERLMATLNAAGEAESTRVRYEIEPAERPVVDFLEQQARMREELPVRTLHHCCDCGHEKVSNPDYKKLIDRNRKLQALTGAVGLSFRGGAVSPFLLVGTLFRMKKLDPDYVCPRCQGMESDDSIATFCPDCGSLRKEAVLRDCAKCGHDFRADIGKIDLWHPSPPPPKTGPPPSLSDG